MNTSYGSLDSQARLLRRGMRLEWFTLSWNVAGVVVLTVTALAASSVALAGFGLDSLIEIGASIIVLWELSGAGEARQRRALRLIGAGFIALATYLTIQSSIALLSRHAARPSMAGIVWTAATAAVMFVLASFKRRTGRTLANRVLETEGRVTLIDGVLAASVLVGLSANAMLGWWWADPVVGILIVYYAVREALKIFRPVDAANA